MVIVAMHVLQHLRLFVEIVELLLLIALLVRVRIFGVLEVLAHNVLPYVPHALVLPHAQDVLMQML